MTIKSLWLALLLAPILLTGVKIPRNKGGPLFVPQVPIRLTNIWYGIPDGVMDLLPSRGDLNRLSSTKKKSTNWVYPTLVS